MKSSRMAVSVEPHTSIAQASAKSPPTSIAPVTVYPSRLSLNTWYGCSLGCRYCCLQMDQLSETPHRPVRICDPQTALSSLDALWERAPQMRERNIVVADHTEPFLTREIQADTLELLKGLEERGVHSPVMLTSKVCPSLDLIREISKLDLRLSVFVSVADTGHARLGRVDIANLASRLSMLRAFSERSVHSILYLKPLGPWTSASAVASIVAQNIEVIDQVVLSPLQEPSGHTQYVEIGVQADSRFGFGATHEDAIVQAIKSVAPDLVISRKRSCAVNRRWGLQCKSTSAAKGTDLFENAVQDRHGYCSIEASTSFAGIGAQELYVLSRVGYLLDSLDMKWGISDATKDEQNSGESGGLGISISEDDMSEVKKRVRDAPGRSPLGTWMGCKGTCSRIDSEYLAPVAGCKIEGPTIVRFSMNKVHVDLSACAPEALGAIEHRTMAGLQIPVLAHA